MKSQAQSTHPWGSRAQSTGEDARFSSCSSGKCALPADFSAALALGGPISETNANASKHRSLGEPRNFRSRGDKLGRHLGSRKNNVNQLGADSTPRHIVVFRVRSFLGSAFGGLIVDESH